MCPAIFFDASSGALNALFLSGESVSTIPMIFSAGMLRYGDPKPRDSPGLTSGIGLRFGGGSSP